jgi:hypothetical protein
MVTELFYLLRYAASFALAPFVSASQLRQKAFGKGWKGRNWKLLCLWQVGCISVGFFLESEGHMQHHLLSA